MNVTGRIPLYRAIHKALRLKMAQFTIQCGQTNPAEESELLATLASADELLNLCEKHLQIENHIVHAVIKARLPQGAREIEADHHHHETSIDSLRQWIKRARAQRHIDDMLFHQFYLDMNEFIAENYQHMYVEETRFTELIWAHFSDEDIQAIDLQIKRNAAPEDMLTLAALILTASHHQDRVNMLTAMKQNAPAQMQQKLMATLSSVLDPVAWTKLSVAMNAAT